MSETHDMPTGRRLARSGTDRYLGGVCGGVAAHLGIDPVVLRVLVGVSVFFGPWIVVASYLVLWLVLPEEDGPARPRRHGPLFAVVLAVPVAILLGGIAVETGDAGWPIAALLVLAVALLAGRRHPVRYAAPPAPAEAPAEAAPDEPQVAAWWHEPPRRRERKPYSPLARATVGVALLATGGSVLAGASPRTSVAVGLLAVGVGMLVGTFRGRGRPLLPLAALLSVALVATHHATVPEATASRGTYVRPVRLAELDSYSWLTGALTMDLTGLEPPPGGGYVEHSIDVGAGHVVVIVPFGLPFSFDASVGAGTLVTHGNVERGVGRRSGGRGGSGELTRVVLDITVGIGRLEIRHAQP